MRNVEAWKPSWVVLDEATSQFSAKINKLDSHSWYIMKLITEQYIPVFRKYCTGRLLDVGCGKVPFYQVYQDLVEENICMDLSSRDDIESFLDIQTDINKVWPIEDNSFDTVFSTDVLAHIRNPWHYFKESARVLKSGGNLVITTPFVYWLSEYPYDYYRLSKFALEEICEENDLRVVDLKTYGAHGDVLMDTLNKCLDGRIGFRFFKLLNWLMKSTGTINRLNQRNKENYPLGYILVAKKN